MKPRCPEDLVLPLVAASKQRGHQRLRSWLWDSRDNNIGNTRLQGLLMELEFVVPQILMCRMS